MELTLDIKEERINFFLELIKQFDFVNIKNNGSIYLMSQVKNTPIPTLSP